jgi:hypothetical protein
MRFVSLPGFIGRFVTPAAMPGLMEFIFRAYLFHLGSLWAFDYEPYYGFLAIA